MNLYFWLILFASVIILAKGAIGGFHNGFVKEVEGLAAGFFAVVVLVLISSLVRGGGSSGASSKAIAIALLIVLGILYALFRIILSSLHLFAGLPVIRLLDQVLGLAAGGAKAFLLLYIVDYFLRIWLNL